MTARNRHDCVKHGCEQLALFGENVAVRKGELGTWRCLEHDREHRAEREAAGLNPEIPARPQRMLDMPSEMRAYVLGQRATMT